MRNVLRLKGLFIADVGSVPESKVIDVSNFRGALGHSIVISGSEQTEVLVGLGHEKDFSPQVLRIALRSLSNLNLDGHQISIDHIVDRIAPTIEPNKSVPLIAAFLLSGRSNLSLSHDSKDLGNSTAMAEAQGIRLARAITNAPGTAMNPNAFAELAINRVRTHHSQSRQFLGRTSTSEDFPRLRQWVLVLHTNHSLFALSIYRIRKRPQSY